MARSILIHNLDDHVVARLQHDARERGITAGAYISRLVELGDRLRLQAQAPTETEVKRISAEVLAAVGLS